jgi:hypothetical protein
MAPATSDVPDDRRPGVHPTEDDRIDRWTIQGREAFVHRRSDEVYVEWRAGQPAHFGVRVGDRLKDADADVSSPGITEWTVTEITPDRVVGERVDTGERREFDRGRVERGLVVGNYATALSGFPRVTVHAVGSWEAYDRDDDEGTTYRGRPYVTVVAYGNNGQAYGLRYRHADEDAPEHVSLWREEVAVGALDDTRREQLADAVEAALGVEGYAID